METVSSKDCSSVDESPITITSSAQVGAPQKKGPMCEPILVSTSEEEVQDVTKKFKEKFNLI